MPDVSGGRLRRPPAPTLPLVIALACLAEASTPRAASAQLVAERAPEVDAEEAPSALGPSTPDDDAQVRALLARLFPSAGGLPAGPRSLTSALRGDGDRQAASGALAGFLRAVRTLPPASPMAAAASALCDLLARAAEGEVQEVQRAINARGLSSRVFTEGGELTVTLAEQRALSGGSGRRRSASGRTRRDHFIIVRGPERKAGALISASPPRVHDVHHEGSVRYGLAR